MNMNMNVNELSPEVARLIAEANIVNLLGIAILLFIGMCVGIYQSVKEKKGWKSGIWVPMQMVVALGMLAPLFKGYTVAQIAMSYIFS